jgi:hypothetical protein
MGFTTQDFLPEESPERNNPSPPLPPVPPPPLHKEPLAPYGAQRNGVPSEREYDGGRRGGRQGRQRGLFTGQLRSENNQKVQELMTYQHDDALLEERPPPNRYDDGSDPPKQKRDQRRRRGEQRWRRRGGQDQQPGLRIRKY